MLRAAVGGFKPQPPVVGSAPHLNPLLAVMKTVRIFSDRIHYRIRLEGF